MSKSLTKPSKKVHHKIKLFLADDHAGIRDSMVVFLNDHEDFHVVGATGRGSEIVKMVARLRPDIVLMDIDMPDVSGICVTEELSKKYPEIKVIMFSGYSDEACKVRSFLAGAANYINKSEDLGKTVEMIRNIHHSRENPLNEALKKRLNSLPEGAAKESLIHELTPAEISVLDFLKDGKELKKAAEMMRISPKTLESHLTRINSKLGAANLRESIYNAAKLNIISMR